MKLFPKLMLGALALTMWSCSSDEPNSNGSFESKGDFYANLTLNMGTRSTTTDPGTGNEPAQSNDGYEFGKDFENNVYDICVVLAEKATDGSYKYVTSAVSNAVADINSNAPVFVIQFESEKLAKQASKEVYVFAYCNADTQLQNWVGTLNEGDAFADKTGALTGDGGVQGTVSNPYNPITNSISEPKRFLMTNALPQNVTLPAYSVLSKQHTTRETAFNLGEVKVERVSCRFDFMQTTVQGQSEPNLYPVTEGISNQQIASIRLDGMALFNEAKEYYLLPHMSADSLYTTPVICGNETSNNYVMSPNADTKRTFMANPTSAAPSDLYYFPVSTLPNAYTYTPISAVANGIQDNENSVTNQPSWTHTGDYRIWRYATENTIPGIYGQRHALTTGVIFRGEIVPVTNAAAGTPAKTLADAMASKKTIYAFSQTTGGSNPQISVVLGTAMDVYKYSAYHNPSQIRAKFVDALRAGYFKLLDKDGKQIAVTASTTEDVIFAKETGVADVQGETTNNNALYAEQNNYDFIAYTPTDGHYYVYYYYYNRHNDNGLNTMGVMEFATVRNNIYKLKVDNIMRFGLPGDKPDKPDTPDETPDIYFKVSVKVLDWVVRVNNIIF